MCCSSSVERQVILRIAVTNPGISHKMLQLSAQPGIRRQRTTHVVKHLLEAKALMSVESHYWVNDLGLEILAANGHYEHKHEAQIVD